MKTTRISTVTVAMLAMFAVAACSDNNTDTLNGSGSSANRLPDRGASDNTSEEGTDPDKKGPASSTSTNGETAETTPVGVPAGGTGANPTPGTTPSNPTTPTTPTTPGAPGTGTGAGGGAGGTVVLNTYSKVWVTGDNKGPAKVGKNTGAGIMDANFHWNEAKFKQDPTKVELMTVYTRSNNTPNGNNSYMQGGVAFATLTAKGVQPGPEINLPNLNGERTWMRPVACFISNNRALVMAASEDNGVNNNPIPSAFILNTTDGSLVQIPNNNRQNNINKPTNLIRLAVAQGINVDNPNNQRGPHTVQPHPTMTDTCVVGMQYNNQAQEAYSVTVNADNSIKMNWLVRYSNTAQHCRPQVAVEPGSNTMYVAAVEADNQPAEIGFRVSAVDAMTGRIQNGLSKIAVRSQPNARKYVSEPVLNILGDKLAISYGTSQPARNKAAGENGHAGGSTIDNAVLLSRTDFSVVGAPSVGVGQYARHGSSFVTKYGPEATAAPSLAIISGSSTGTGGGFIQMYPLKADGSLGIKDTAKVYQVSAFSDVANLQARGKRNPQDQARGFINGLGNVPNPGYTTDPAVAVGNFMPEVKSFSFSTVTGYSGPEALGQGQKESIWLSLVPATWREGILTIPGTPTDKPGTNEDGTGPAPRSTVPGTNPSGEAGGEGSVLGDEATRPGSKTRAFDASSGGCAVSTQTPASNFGLIGLAVAGVIAAIRRRKGAGQEEA